MDYSVVKTDEIISFVSFWIELEAVKWDKPKEKNKFQMISCIGGTSQTWSESENTKWNLHWECYTTPKQIIPVKKGKKKEERGIGVFAHGGRKWPKLFYRYLSQKDEKVYLFASNYIINDLPSNKMIERNNSMKIINSLPCYVWCLRAVQRYQIQATMQNTGKNLSIFSNLLLFSSDLLLFITVLISSL